MTPPAFLLPLLQLVKRISWALALVGAVLVVVGACLSWSYDSSILDDLSINLYPGGLQILAIIVAVLAAVQLWGRRQPKPSHPPWPGVGLRLILWPVNWLWFLLLRVIRRRPARPQWPGGLVRTIVWLVTWPWYALRLTIWAIGHWFDTTRGLRAAGLWLLLFMALVLAAITVESDGLVNVNPGGWISFVGALVLYVGASGLPPSEPADASRAAAPRGAEILVIAAMMGAILFGAAYALGREDAWTFVLFLIFAAGVVAICVRSGFISWFGHAATRNRTVLTLAAFVVAFLFPFTQQGSDANMSIATQVLIFAATAMGLNIVVGLAGLLDLGYIAFLGSGAYVAAMLSQSAFATIDIKPPFLVVVLCGACVAAVFGLIIGSPTLRVSGDYLAIVTLGFGEIFRLTMFNLDGINGPKLTNGPNGIPAIPDLKFGSFNFADKHDLLGIPLGRFSNYYFLLLVLIGFVILVFARLNNSRIGRGWVAIREDEKAAEAMGVNVFGLKLLAFAIGAFLAGLAGTIKAHQDVAVSPNQYIFLESAFLLAAVVLGGMGTIAGVLVGATILKLMPEKLRFFSEYRLLFFGLLLVLMMRFRPEGLVASKRRQLEFHEEDEELAVAVESDLAEEVAK